MGQTNYNGTLVTYDDSLSFKDFTGRTYLNFDFNGKTIYRSCFSQEAKTSDVFPSDMSGVTFIMCNLDNIVLPAGNTAIDCSQKFFEAQNDLRDWIVDADGNPLEVLNKKSWQMLGFSVDPADIPEEPIANISDITRTEA